MSVSEHSRLFGSVLFFVLDSSVLFYVVLFRDNNALWVLRILFGMLKHRFGGLNHTYWDASSYLLGVPNIPFGMDIHTHWGQGHLRV